MLKDFSNVDTKAHLMCTETENSGAEVLLDGGSDCNVSSCDNPVDVLTH